MKVKLLKKVRQRYGVYKYTHISPRTPLYNYINGSFSLPTKEKPLYVVLDNDSRYFQFIGAFCTRTEAADKLAVHIVKEYREKMPKKDKNIYKKVWWVNKK